MVTVRKNAFNYLNDEADEIKKTILYAVLGSSCYGRLFKGFGQL